MGGVLYSDSRDENLVRFVRARSLFAEKEKKKKISFATRACVARMRASLSLRLSFLSSVYVSHRRGAPIERRTRFPHSFFLVGISKIRRGKSNERPSSAGDAGVTNHTNILDARVRARRPMSSGVVRTRRSFTGRWRQVVGGSDGQIPVQADSQQGAKMRQGNLGVDSEAHE